MANHNVGDSTIALSENCEKDRKCSKIERMGKTHWQSDYARDIFETMLEQEQRRLPLQYLSTQLEERKVIMQLLEIVTRTCKLSRCAFHLAIYYVDRFADQYKIRPDKFALVGLICLHIAAQIEDAEGLIPRYSELNRFVNEAYTAGEYKVVERMILCFFNFNIIRPTTASFVELFACSFFKRTEFLDYIRMLDNNQGDPSIVPYPRYDSFEEMLAKLASLLLRLANCTLSISTFGNVPPSLLAAACIAVVRQVNGVQRWSQYLTDLTTYTEAQVSSYSETISMYYYYHSQPLTTQVAETGLSQQNLIICVPTLGQNNPNWSSPDSGFEEQLNASSGFKAPYITAGTDFKEAVTVPTDIKEQLTETKDLVVEMETYSINNVQVLKPASPPVPAPYTAFNDSLKRRREDDDIEDDAQPNKQLKLANECKA